MKKFILIFLSIFFIFIISSCNDNQKDNNEENSNGNNNNQEEIITTNKTLVAYFSQTNNTKKIADYIIEIEDADELRILPKIEYTAEDLVYYDETSRSWLEQNDENARPEIKNSKIDLTNYDVIYLGYPIWYGYAPKIIYSFLDDYKDSLAGKKIVPFCTSGSTNIKNSVDELMKLNNEVMWFKGMRFADSSSKEDVESWINNMIGLREEKTIYDIKMRISGIDINFDIENNESTLDLLEKLKKKDITISANRYGGFEQVGPLGLTLKSNDVQMTTSPGDIVLYSSNQICIFFGSNSWRYTLLGHINLSATELTNLLNKELVSIQFYLA